MSEPTRHGEPAAPANGEGLLAFLRARPRLRALVLGGAVVLLAAVAFGWWYYGGRESPDDAQVDGHIVAVSSRVGGTVMAVKVEDNQRVAVGTVLVEVDPRDYRIALQRAEADLADARAALTGAQAGVPITSTTTASQVSAAGAGVERAQAGSQASGREVEAARARLNLTQARLREARANAERLNRDRDRQDLRLFKERTYATAVALITAMGFGLYASLVLMPVLLQTLMRYPALQAGFVMAPRGLGSLVVMPFVGIAIEKTDPRRIIGLGFLVNAVTMYWLGMLNLNAGFWDFFWPQFIQGAGLGLLFVPLTTVAMDRIRPEAMGAATSLFNLLRNIGGSVGIATVQTLLARYRQTHGNVMVGHVDAYSPAPQILFNNLRSSFMAAGADVTTATQRAYAALYGMVQQQAAMLSFIDGFKLLAVVFLLLVPFVALMRKPQHHGRNR
ncbi:MAG: MFS transporter [Acidobacteria bacterium]|nr:MAG: MFS transporter [Acidobacteriota bacterium]